MKLRLPFTRRDSIGFRIFAGFVAMGLITAALGGYGLYVLRATGRLVVSTYDGPLMAMNFARSASLTFTLMDKEALRRNVVPPEDRPAVDVNIETLAGSFFEDLDVVTDRAAVAAQRKVISEIRELVGSWMDRVHDRGEAENAAEVDAIAEKIIERFDVLVELTADYSFVERRKAVWSVSYFTYSSLAVISAALLMSTAITWLLARRIVRPLLAAARVADKIAAGELQTHIPAGGRDETGILLQSMTVMQDNIRAMMEREMAERRSAQRRLVDALEGSREGMVLVDGDGRIVLVNTRFAELCPAAAPSMLRGAAFADAFAQFRPLLAWAADLSPEEAEIVEEGPAHPQFSVGEYQIGDGRWVRFSRSATREGGFVLFLSDFTEIKDREEHFKQAKIQAEVASTAKTNFLANMSHELRTPLNAIIGFSEIISRQAFGAGDPRYAKYAADILQSGQHLLEIINSILNLAKSEAGRLELALETVDLRGVIDDCATMIRQQCERAGLSIDVERPDEPLTVEGEPAKLRQIVLNLLSNAVKFTPAGGAIRLRAALCPEGVLIEVADTGIGMTTQDIDVALTPFGQVDSALSRRYEGTGLGLPLTAAFVELHAGKLNFESTPGRGTKVTVTLPAVAAGFIESAPPVAAAS